MTIWQLKLVLDRKVDLKFYALTIGSLSPFDAGLAIVDDCSFSFNSVPLGTETKC